MRQAVTGSQSIGDTRSAPLQKSTPPLKYEIYCTTLPRDCLCHSKFLHREPCFTQERPRDCDNNTQIVIGEVFVGLPEMQYFRSGRPHGHHPAHDCSGRRCPMTWDEKVSCLCNSMTGGNGRETFCSRVFRRSLDSRRWEMCRVVLDWVFHKRHKDHCWRCYRYHIRRTI